MKNKTLISIVLSTLLLIVVPIQDIYAVEEIPESELETASDSSYIVKHDAFYFPTIDDSEIDQTSNDIEIIPPEIIELPDMMPEQETFSIESPIYEAAPPAMGWRVEDGVYYWYENNIRQGTYDDSKGVIGDGTIRGREIYDPGTDAWYWLDSVYNGAKAADKEVWMPYIYQGEETWDDAGIHGVSLDSNSYSENGIMAQMAAQVENAIKNKAGKWVRYRQNGAMIKGWYSVNGRDAFIYPNQVGNTYYYDQKTGLMAKGQTQIDGKTYSFDTITGVLQYSTVDYKLPTTAPAGVLNVQDFGASVNDGTDDTEAFNDAIREAFYSGLGKVFVPAGNYTISIDSNGEGIRMRSGTSIIMDPKAVLEVAATDREGYAVISCSNVEKINIIGGEIRGERNIHKGTSGEWGMGIDICDCSEIRIAYTRINNNWGDGIYIGTNKNDGTGRSTNISVINCNIHDNRRSNISIVAASGVTVESCKIANANGHAPQCGIIIEPNKDNKGRYTVSDRIRIRNTTINTVGSGNRDGQFFTFMSIRFADSVTNSSNDVIIKDCTFNGDCGNFSSTNAQIINTRIAATFYDMRNTRLDNVTYAGKWNP